MLTISTLKLILPARFRLRVTHQALQKIQAQLVLNKSNLQGISKRYKMLLIWWSTSTWWFSLSSCISWTTSHALFTQSLWYSCVFSSSSCSITFASLSVLASHKLRNTQNFRIISGYLRCSYPTLSMTSLTPICLE